MNRNLPKLVRDKCQELYPDNTYRRVTDSTELLELFDKKVKEELSEVMEAAQIFTHERVVEECADLFEAVKGLFRALQVDTTVLARALNEKRVRRGVFNDGLVLEECTLWVEK